MTLRPSRPGFTLIELLVSIAIIAVLLAILMPALPRIRDAGRKAACSSNLRNVGQAVEMYKNQYKEVFPVARYMPFPWLTSEDEVPSLPVALAEFMEENTPAWRCPGDKIVAKQTYQDADGVTRECGASYSYRSELAGLKFEETFWFRRFEFPVHQIPVSHDFDGETYEREDGQQIPVDFFHSTRNILFADSHVGEFPSRRR